MSDLQARMALYTEGQATWPVLNSPHKCTACTHLRKRKLSEKKWKEGQGYCGYAAKLTNGKKWSVAFDAKTAIACSQFEAK